MWEAERLSNAQCGKQLYSLVYHLRAGLGRLADPSQIRGGESMEGSGNVDVWEGVHLHPKW